VLHGVVDMRRTGTYMWTASSAGWLVIAYVTGLEEALIVSVACALTAVIWWSYEI
jgi:hypothetical protein